jgi:DNA-binding PadR family transcriptional regulator
LAELGIHKRGAGFYQLMSRMEKAGLVVGWYEDVAVGTHVVQQRKYTITAEGSNAIDDWRSILLTAIA